jgi:hypothetical protein
MSKAPTTTMAKLRVPIDVTEAILNHVSSDPPAQSGQARRGPDFLQDGTVSFRRMRRPVRSLGHS